MKLEFKPEDFEYITDDPRYAYIEAAKVANARLMEMLKESQIVFGNPNKTTPFGNLGFYILKAGKKPNRSHTHTAKLVEIEEIVQKSHD